MLQVDSVLVISQMMGDNTFHFLCENLPRIAPFLPSLLSPESANVSMHSITFYRILNLHSI
jgi:hypothetical protein